MSTPSVREFSVWLSERCEFLRNLEGEAERVLNADKDTDKYRALMCQKAMFLEALPEEAGKLLPGLPRDVAAMISSRLEQFSFNASRALELGSVFYMYALLYPDDHIKGRPNNLEILAAEVAAMAAE